MKGKEALQSANRRLREALDRVAVLEAQVKAERVTSALEVTELKARLTRLEFGQERRVTELVADRVAAWRDEHEQKVADLVHDHQDRASRAMDVLFGCLNPVKLHEVGEVLGASVSDVEAEQFLAGNPAFFENCPSQPRVLPNRSVKRRVRKTTERAAKAWDEKAEREMSLRPARYGLDATQNCDDGCGCGDVGGTDGPR